MMKVPWVVILILTASSTVSADSISLRADAWCPYNCEPDSDKPGYMVEIAQYAFKHTGNQVQYETLNWPRAILETKNGQHDGIIGASKNDAPGFIYPEIELGTMQPCFYAKQENPWTYRGIDSLSQVSLGVINGYAYSEELDPYVAKYIQDTARIQVGSGDDALKNNALKLTKGRIDILVEDRAVMSYFLKKTGQSQRIKNVGCAKHTDVFIAFSPASPKSQEYANILARGLRELRESGKLKTILESYGLTDWK